jgi:hypothetical protein
MTPRSRSKSVVFSHPFELKGVDRILPAGDYRVVTDEELIEELSFPVYRRISTMIFVPGPGRQASSLEMVTIDPRDLEAAQDRDSATNQLPARNAILATFRRKIENIHARGLNCSFSGKLQARTDL